MSLAQLCLCGLLSVSVDSHQLHSFSFRAIIKVSHKAELLICSPKTVPSLFDSCCMCCVSKEQSIQVLKWFPMQLLVSLWVHSLQITNWDALNWIGICFNALINANTYHHRTVDDLIFFLELLCYFSKTGIVFSKQFHEIIYETILGVVVHVQSFHLSLFQDELHLWNQNQILCRLCYSLSNRRRDSQWAYHIQSQRFFTLNINSIWSCILVVAKCRKCDERSYH